MKATNEKLELVHLVGYLPDVEILILNYKSDYVGMQRAKVNGYYFINEDIYLTYVGGSTGKKFGKDCKLILQTMDFLTKPITHNGEKFVPMDEINKIHTLEFEDGLFSDYVSSGWSVMWLPYLAIQKLYEWHFDIHKLIEKGLGIDLNTIEKGLGIDLNTIENGK